MTVKVTGTATFSCSKCGQQYTLKADQLDFQPESSSERGMGKETQHVSEHEDYCNSCGQPMSIRFELWEYPVGVVNYSTHSESGASSVRNEFHLTYVDSVVSNDAESSRVVGAIAGGAILGASLGGPAGAIIGGVIGAMLGDSVNKSKKSGGAGG